jgi:hypothetical protein
MSIEFRDLYNETDVTADIVTVNDITVAGNMTITSISPNKVLISDSNNNVSTITQTNGQLLIGNTGLLPTASTLTAGSSMTVTNGAGSITLNPIQNIRTTDTPTFQTVQVTNGIQKGFAMYDNSNQLTYLSLAGLDGNIPIGSASGQVYSQRLTAGSGISIGNSAGHISIASTVTSALSAKTVVYTDASGALASLALTDGQLVVGSTGNIPVATTLTAGTGIGISNAAGSITVNNTASSALVAKSIVYTDASNNLASLTLTNGQLAIGSTGLIPVASTLTGTTNQVNVSNAAGSITLSTPQDIAASSSPTFKGLIVTTTGIVSGGQITGTYIVLKNATNQIITGSGTTTTLNLPAPATTATLTFPNTTDVIVGRDTTDTLTNKTLTLPIISSISNTGILTLPTSTDTLIGKNTTDTLTNKTMTSPTINSPTISGTITTNLSASLPVKTNASSQLTAAAINLAGSEVTGILPVAKLGISAGSGIALSIAGVISTTGAVSTTNITLTDNTNQILMGTTNTLQLTAPVATQAGNIVVTMPIVTSTLATLNGTETFTNKSIWGNSMITGTGTVYQTGTASRSGSTITGSGTTFTQAMAGGVLRFSTSGEICFINAFTSVTALTSNISGTVADQAYAIRYNVFCTETDGTRMGMPSTLYRNGFSIDWPTITASDRMITRDASMAMSNKIMYNNNYFALSTDGNRKVFINPTSGITTPCTEHLTFTGTTTGVIHSVPDSATNNSFIMSATATGTQTITDSIKLNTSGGTASALNYYEEWTGSGMTATGVITIAPAYNCYIVRVGKSCTLEMPDILLTSANTGSFFTVTTLPSRFFPARSSGRILLNVVTNSAHAVGECTIDTSGVIKIYAGLNLANFTAAAFCAVYGTKFSYICA